MLGELTHDQCLQVLRSEILGRLACYADRKLYIVPVTFVFDGEHIYAHSKSGMKVRMMRRNPHVCFQVDHIENMANWRSVIVWGKYQEIRKRTDHVIAMKVLRDRLGPLTISESVSPTYRYTDPKFVEKPSKAEAFRISIDEITGRFEKN